MGRASIALFRGHLGESLHFHWWAIPFHLLVLTAFVWLIRDTVRKSDSFWRFIRKPMNPWLLALIFVLVFVNWIRAIYLDL